MTQQQFPIGVFDSGYGGLTVLKEFVRNMPEYDFIYLGDNARAPYGNRSFETVYEYTLECVEQLFAKGCRLVILACNTASAKALRTIQQHDLQRIDAQRRVLGVIRPTSEVVGKLTESNTVGIFATSGTVNSGSYVLEIEKFYPTIKVIQEACPMWVPMVEYNEFDKPGADYFIKQHIERLLKKSDAIDTIILGCTHYPLLMPKIKQYLPNHIKVIAQGEIVAASLMNYLQRHPEMDANCSKNGKLEFYTTDAVETFNEHAAIFFGKEVQSKHLHL
ncbi:MAG: glutamate racemase [Chitinophagales bacterium]|nr:glutamate racemase [Bacteroidota bacterium]